MKSWHFGICILLLSGSAHAGFLEFGATANYKKSNIDSSSYEQVQAFTGSAAYYFGTMSAAEFSYTYGTTVQHLHFADRPDQSTTIFYEMTALDLVLTFAGQDSWIKPYVKGGVGYIIRKDTLFDSAGQQVLLTGQSGRDTGFVPSAGAGLRLGITSQFSLKVGIDAWGTSPRYSNVWDVLFRAGVSVMF